MDLQDPRLRSMLRQANKVANAGKRAAAEQLYRNLLEEAPDLPEAWYGLGQVVAAPEEQLAALEQALTLKPTYAKAARALADLRGEPVPAWAVPAEPEVVEEEPEPEPEPETAVPQTADEAFELVCYRHPNRPTALRCYNCGKPICSSCAVKTPVGYSCPDCIREREGVFFNAQLSDYIVAPLIGLIASLIAGYLVVTFTLGRSFFIIFIMFFIGGLFGRFLGQIAKRSVGRRRGRYLPHVMVVTLILGTAVWLLPYLLVVGFAGITGLIGPGIFLFAAGSTLYSYMK